MVKLRCLILKIIPKGALYEYCKQRIDTIRLKLLKVAAKVIHSARYITFKLCSSCPYQNEFYETLSKISMLQPQRE